MSEVTRILSAIEKGDPAASEKLLPLVYNELRRLAQIKMAQESSAQTLQPTALVHEAYLRLVDSDNPQAWNSQGHFFAAAAKAMRRILVENARRKQRLRHGGGRQRVDMEKIDLSDPNDADFLMALDQSLDLLAEKHSVVARIVNLRFFVGLSIHETAEAMNLSVRTVNRHWAFAKAWLYQQLSEDKYDSQQS